jgi:hypothetical protein
MIKIRSSASLALTVVSTALCVMMGLGRTVFISWLFPHHDSSDGAVNILMLLCTLLLMMRGFDRTFSSHKQFKVAAELKSQIDKKVAIGVVSGSRSATYGEEALLQSRLENIFDRYWWNRTQGIAQIVFSHGLVCNWSCGHQTYGNLNFLRLVGTGATVVYLLVIIFNTWSILLGDLAQLSNYNKAFVAVQSHLASFEGKPGGSWSWFQVHPDFALNNDAATRLRPEFDFFRKLAFVVDMKLSCLYTLNNHDTDQKENMSTDTSENASKPTTVSLDAWLKLMAKDMRNVEIALLNPLTHLNHSYWQYNYKNSVMYIKELIQSNGLTWALHVIALLCYIPTLMNSIMPDVLSRAVEAEAEGHASLEDFESHISIDKELYNVMDGFGFKICFSLLAVDSLLEVTKLLMAWFRMTARRSRMEDPSAPPPIDAVLTSATDAHLVLERPFSGGEVLDVLFEAESSKQKLE